MNSILGLAPRSSKKVSRFIGHLGGVINSSNVSTSISSLFINASSSGSHHNTQSFLVGINKMTNRDEQEARKNFLRKSSPLLSGLRTERSPDNLGLPASVDIPIPGIKDVDMILGEQSGSTMPNRNYTAFQLSLERGKNADVGQAATYYIGGICCLMPEVSDDILEGFRQSGGRVRVTRVPSDAVTIPHQKKAIAFFGYLVTMLYTNSIEDISNISEQYFKALFDAAGFDHREAEDEVMSLFKCLNDVVCYWGYGQLGRIKESILKGSLNHAKEKGSFGDVCSHVAKTLSWSNMTGFYNVYKTLVLTDSPVLRFHGLTHEVSNLHRAVKTVFSTEMPQYFRILGDGSKYYLVESSRFPMLVAVSEQIMRTANDVNFRPSGSRLSEVDIHVAIHRNQFADAFLAGVMQNLNVRRQDDED